MSPLATLERIPDRRLGAAAEIGQCDAVGDGLDGAVHDRMQLVHRPVGGGRRPLDDVEELDAASAERLGEELLLALEVVVDRSGREPRELGDVAERTVEASLGEGALGGGEDVGAVVRGARGAPLRSGLVGVRQEFMDVRHAPRVLRTITDALVATMGVLLMGTHLIGKAVA